MTGISYYLLLFLLCLGIWISQDQGRIFAASGECTWTLKHVVHNKAVIRKAILIWIISRIARSIMKKASNPRRKYQ